MADVRPAQFLSDVTDGFRRCRSASLAVAFITGSGLQLPVVAAAISQAVNSGAHLRILLDLSTGNTDPSAVWRLVSLSESHPTVQVRTVLPDEGSMLHSKFYLFDVGGELILVTGSANLSEPGLTISVEHGVTIRGPRDDAFLVDAAKFFDAVWDSPASRPVGNEAARMYEEFCGRRRTSVLRAERRSRASWARLERHLRAVQMPVITWPSPEAAYIMGIVCARGVFNDTSKSIKITLRFNRGSYGNGQVKVWNRSYPAHQVIPRIPDHIVERLQAILPIASITTVGRVITIDLSTEPQIYDVLRIPFRAASEPTHFRLPAGLASAGEDVVTEFVRGFAVACGLITDATSLPRDPLTGLPGVMTVWLRPQTGNKRLFDELHALIEDRLSIPVIAHWREYREPHLKIRCQHFLEIGFGVDWWDKLVEEGALYNEAVLGVGGPP